MYFFPKVLVICFRVKKGYGNFTEIRILAHIKFNMKSVARWGSVSRTYVILATANAGYQTPAKGVYEGKLNVSCSIGENTIETEWSFEYVVKEKT